MTLKQFLIAGILAFNAAANGAIPDPCYFWLMGAVPRIQKAYVIHGAAVIGQDSSTVKANGYGPDAYFVTDLFFRKAGLQVPADAQPVNLMSYQYYDPRKDYNMPQWIWSRYRNRLNRGGGRDHRITKNPDAKNVRADGSLTEKGSGPNEYYSAINGNFDLKDYRTNGLQDDVEVASEYTVMQQLKNASVPVVDYPLVKLAPLEFQKLIGAVDEEGKMKGPVAAQTRRRQSTPRDSFSGVENVSLEDRYTMVAAVLFNNIGHGGINPENMAAGKIDDPGHVTFGYPIMSGVYRCVVCELRAGSRSNGTMVGMMDYYFPGRAIRSYKDYFYRRKSGLRSTTFKFNREIGDGVFNKIAQNYLDVKETLTLSDAQLKSLELLLRQGIAFSSRSSNQETLRLYYESAAALLGGRMPTESLFLDDVDTNFSARFLMQLAALRIVYREGSSRADVNGFIERLSKLLNPDVVADYMGLIQLFEDTLGKSRSKVQVVKTLFSEHLPLNMVIADIKKAKSENPDFATWGSTLKNIIDADSKPIKWNPLQWMRAIDGVLRKYI